MPEFKMDTDDLLTADSYNTLDATLRDLRHRLLGVPSTSNDGSLIRAHFPSYLVSWFETHNEELSVRCLGNPVLEPDAITTISAMAAWMHETGQFAKEFCDEVQREVDDTLQPLSVVYVLEGVSADTRNLENPRQPGPTDLEENADEQVVILAEMRRTGTMDLRLFSTAPHPDQGNLTLREKDAEVFDFVPLQHALRLYWTGVHK